MACGQNKQPEHIGVDIAGDCDIKHDLFNEFPYPFEDNYADEIFSSHFIEHIPMEYVNGKDKLFAFVDECYRILKPGGKLTSDFSKRNEHKSISGPNTQKIYSCSNGVLFF